MTDNYVEPTEEGNLIITKVEKHAEGYWTANVTINGFTATFHDRHGSWMMDIDKNGRMREAKRFVAAALAARVRPKQKAEAKEEEAARAAEPENDEGAAVAKPRLTTATAGMERMWCEPGNHEWYRHPQRGRKPTACPDHRGKPKQEATSAAPVRKNPKKRKG